MLIMPSFKKRLIVEPFQGNYLKSMSDLLHSWTDNTVVRMRTVSAIPGSWYVCFGAYFVLFTILFEKTGLL